MKKRHSRHSKKQSHKPAMRGNPIPNTESPNDTLTHKVLLKRHLMTGAKITGLQALDLYQCFALSQRLGQLRRIHGLPIQSQYIKLPNGKRVKEYWLSDDYINAHKGATA